MKKTWCKIFGGSYTEHEDGEIIIYHTYGFFVNKYDLILWRVKRRLEITWCQIQILYYKLRILVKDSPIISLASAVVLGVLIGLIF